MSIWKSGKGQIVVAHPAVPTDRPARLAPGVLPGGQVPAWQSRLAHLGPTGAAVILLVDCSGSMEGDKLAQAQRGGQDFARDALQRGHNVGLVRFACDASPVLDIGASLAPIARALASLSADGGTNMAAGIRLAHAALLAAKRGRNTICLVTDGAPNDPDATLRVAEAAKADRIRIVAVGTDDADKAFLDLLVSRAEFARKIEASSLMLGVREMALLLPKP